MNKIARPALVAAVLVVALESLAENPPAPAAAAPQAPKQTAGTQLTYQGQLKTNNQLASGSFDVQFTMHSEPTGGTIVAGPIEKPAVAVTGGVIGTQVDFGTTPFTGNAAYMSIAIREADTGDYTPLEPRQQITAVPYALHALDGSGGGVGGSGTANAVAAWTAPGTLGDSTALGSVNLPTTVVLAPGGSGGQLSFHTPAAETGMSIIGSGKRADVRFDGNTLKLLATSAAGPPPATSGIQVDTGGNVGIGGIPNEKLTVEGGGITVNHGGKLQIWMLTQGGTGGRLLIFNAAGQQIAGILGSTGEIFGTVKNFRVDHPKDPGSDIWYASIEGPEAAIYVRGTARLSGGTATVRFPSHFASLVVGETLTIQLTPMSAESEGLAVVESDENGFTVRELRAGRGHYELSWRAEGVRRGYEDYAAVRPKLKGHEPEE